MTEKTRLNIVEAMAGDDEEQAFDQACRFENRVGGHGTYCHNEKVGARKCPYRWTSAEWHKDCEGFEPNPAYTGKWEDVLKPPEQERPPGFKTFKRITSIEVKDDKHYDYDPGGW